MSQPHERTKGLGEPLEQAVKALSDNGLDEAERELLGRLINGLLERKAERARSREQLAKLQADLDEASKTVAALKAQNERLAEERARLEAERDVYLKSLHAMTRKEFTFTPEELDELERNGRSLEGLLKELEGARGD
jgi:hypothetical protein